MNLQTAFQYRKNNHYQEAIQIYQPLWQQNPLDFNEWDGWSYAYCLSKQNRHVDALEVCRQLYQRFNKVEILNTLYARCIYYTQFNPKKPVTIDVLKKATKAIFDLAPPGNPYSFAPRAIFYLVKELMKAQDIDWAEIEMWLLKLDPDLLDDRPFRMTDAKGRNIELASPREEWYANFIKTKAGLNQPQLLLDAINAARNKKIKWHYSNDIWFARKEAFAWKQLGDSVKAEKIMREILTKKKDWFLIFDLAQLITDKEESMGLFCMAAMAQGKAEMKLKLFETMYKNLKDETEFGREAALHLCLIMALREENDWPVKQELKKELEAYAVDPEREGSSALIQQSLFPFWRKMAAKMNNNSMIGILVKILPDGKSGFIRCGDLSYFASLRDLKASPNLNSRVSFELVDSFDKKKNKSSKMAVNIIMV